MSTPSGATTPFARPPVASPIASALPPQVEKTSIVIVGTGFAGLCMAIKLKEAGIHDFVMLERGDDVGGTWRDNHYPGAACDVPSNVYSFSFEPNPNWTRSFPTQPELFEYQRHCARKYGLLPHVRLHADMAGSRYDEATSTWTVTTRDGRQFVGQVLVSGIGGLSNPAYPDIPGLESFQGEAFHSATWDHTVDLRGKRVAVIGSGASAIQFVPQIAPKVAHLDYYQRTPPWVLPKPDRPMKDWERTMFRALPITQKLYRWVTYWTLELRVLGFTRFPSAMKMVENWGKRHIAKHVKDPELRRKLTPTYRAGCKRILMANDYYQAVARPNVEVITDRVKEVRSHGIVAADGRERAVDVIIFGTGFKVQEPAPVGAFIGKGGVDLGTLWQQTGSEAFRGTTVAGFPNLFMIVGPNTGLGHNSMIFMIESQVRYIMGAILTMRRKGLRSVEVKPQPQAMYNERIQRMLGGTVWNIGGCQSWYLNAQGKNTTLWPTFTFKFRSELSQFDAGNYVLQGQR